MKKIIFLRPAPYDDLIPGKDLLSSFDLAGLQIYDPVLEGKLKVEIIEKVEQLKKEFEIKNFFTSPATRCLKTANMFTQQPVIVDELKEIKFSVRNLVSSSSSKQDFDVNKLRKDLIVSIIENRAEEDMNSILNRIMQLHKNIIQNSENTLCVSHAFIMKFFEVSYENNFKTKDHRIFLNNYDWEQKPYEFLCGFCVILDNNNDVLKMNKIQLVL